VMSLNFPLKGLTAVPRDLLRRDLRFRPLTVASGTAVFISGAAAVIVAAVGGGVWALVIYSVAESAVTLVTTWVAAGRAHLASPRLRFHRNEFRDMLAFGTSVSGYKLLYYLQLSLDNLIVGKVLGATALGYYGLAYRLMLYPVQRVGEVVASVTLPAFATMQDDRDRLRMSFQRGISLIGVVCFPFSLLILVAAPLLVPFAFGSQWTPAVTTVQILALNGPRIASSKLNGSVFQAVGKPSWDTWIAMLSLALYALGFSIGVRFGITGMAVAYTIVGYLLIPVEQHMIARALSTSMRSTLRGLVPLVLPSALLVAAAEAVNVLLPSQMPVVARIGLILSVGLVAYVGALMLTGRELMSLAISLIRRR